MALSGKKPIGYPDIQSEMGLDAVGPVTFSLQAMQNLACIYYKPDRLGGDICLHTLFNRPDVPQPVIEHILRHELLHLKIPPRQIAGKFVSHPPEFWEEEKVAVPWRSDSWAWIYHTFSGVIKLDIPNECIWVKKTWRQLQKYCYPSWKMILDDNNIFADKHEQIKDLMEGL